MKNKIILNLTVVSLIIIINANYLMGQTSQSNSEDVKAGMSFELYQNTPEPFNDVTNIKFEVKKKEEIRLDVYNSTGIKVANLVSGILEPGQYSVNFKANHSMIEGIYYYVLSQDNSTEIKRMIYKLVE
ncbi:MAG: T9SS type A sorting domain-containing protein [Ignavibacteria bacterium]|nr:T9SS type A sorting domain-containing protein [Ignavibacteria bacterium]